MSDSPITFLGMPMDRRTRWNFLCEAANAALAGGFIGIVGPFTLPLAVRLGASSFEVGLITAAPFIANLLAPFWATRSQNSRKLPWVVIPQIIWRGGLGLVGFLKSPMAITALWAGTHFSLGAANPAYGALVQKVFPAPIRGRLMGYVRIGLAASMLPVTLMGGRLLDRFSPAWLFLAAGLIGLVGVGAYALTKEPAAPAPSGPGAPTGYGPVAGLRLALADPPFRRFLAAAVLFHGGVLVAQPLYSVFQVKQMGLSNTQIGYIAVAWNVAWLTAFAAWGRAIDSRGPRFVVAGAAFFYLGLPLAYGSGGGSFSLALVGAMCQGIADAGMDLGGWNMILSVNPERVGPYTSASMLATGLRGALGPLLGSWLLGAFGFQPTFLTAATLIGSGFLLFTFGNRSDRPAPAFQP